jgi:hypothetical protein
MIKSCLFLEDDELIPKLVSKFGDAKSDPVNLMNRDDMLNKATWRPSRVNDFIKSNNQSDLLNQNVINTPKNVISNNINNNGQINPNDRPWNNNNFKPKSVLGPLNQSEKYIPGQPLKNINPISATVVRG